MPSMSELKRLYMIEALGLPSNTTMSNTDLETQFWSKTSGSGQAYRYGFNAKRLPKWQTALARVRDNAGDAKMMWLGDSQFFGIGSTNYATIASLGAPMSRLSTLLAAGGVPSSHGFITPGSDQRWTAAANWTITFFGLGSLACYNSAVNAGTLVCTDSRTTWDRCDVYYMQGPGLGTTTCTATGGSTVNAVGANASSSIQKVTAIAAAPSSSNTITLTPTVATCYIVGVEFWLNGTSKVRIGNGGVGTVGVAEHVAASQIATWGTLPVCAAYQADVVGIGLGVNDRGNGRTPTQFQTDMVTLITGLKAQGSDVIICSEAPAGQTPQSTNEARYNQILSDLATFYNTPYYAYCERCQSYASYNAQGMMFDALHQNNKGFWDWAGGIAPMLLGI